MGKKMSDSNIDALFEKMSRQGANSMNGTHPPKSKNKKSVKGTTKKKK